MKNKKKCRRCGGRQIMEWYLHVEHGVCFRCGGTGIEPWTWKEAQAQKAAERAQQEARAETRAAELKAAQAQ